MVGGEMVRLGWLWSRKGGWVDIQQFLLHTAVTAIYQIPPPSSPLHTSTAPHRTTGPLMGTLIGILMGIPHGDPNTTTTTTTNIISVIDCAPPHPLHPPA
jgi:hypothetical protein